MSQHQIPAVRSPLVTGQRHVADLTNKTPRGRRRVRALLGLGVNEDVSPGLVYDARQKAAARTLAGAHNDALKREQAQRPPPRIE
jgi:hypothetical protein